MYSFKNFALALAIAFSLVITSQAKADYFSDSSSTVDLGTGNIHLGTQQMKAVQLGDWRYVKKLYLNAIGNSCDATFEVMVNGDIKGTVHVPGRDPFYVVTVNEVTSSIEFRHLSGCSATIQRVQIVQSDRTVSGINSPSWRGCRRNCSDIDFPVRNEASMIARRAIRLVDELQGYADYKQFGEYLLPIKKAAARAYAGAEARGVLSQKVHDLLTCLQVQIVYARPYVENTFERSNAFELAIELLSLENKLDAILR